MRTLRLRLVLVDVAGGRCSSVKGNRVIVVACVIAMTLTLALILLDVAAHSVAWSGCETRWRSIVRMHTFGSIKFEYNT